MHFYRFGLVGIIVLVGGVAFAHPRTEVVVQKPVTPTEVSHPTTSVTVTRPKTTVQTFKPVTSVQVSYPTTSVMVSKPSTDVQVFHPTTSVQVTHPGEMPLATTVPTGNNSSSAGGKKTAAVNTVPSSSSSTSMSGYQAPKAKDFKAAALGGGANGLGNKTDEATKDAAAASFQTPKGEAASLDSVLKSANNVNHSNITKAIEGKLK